MPLEEYPFASHYLEVEGQRLHYVDEGSGEPVLLLHGNPTWSFLYRKVIPQIARTHRALALDYLGFGLSDKPCDGDYTIPGHVHRLTRFIEALELRNLTLVMHDWGGPIGFSYATTCPDNIKRLVILNTTAFASRSAAIPLALRLLRAPVIGELLVRRLNLFLTLGLTLGTERPLSRAAWAGYRLPFPNYASRIAVLAFPREIPDSSRHRNAILIREVEDTLGCLRDRPTLIIWGARDPIFTVDDARRFREAFPNHWFYSLSDASHFVQEDRPDIIVRRVVEFIHGT